MRQRLSRLAQKNLGEENVYSKRFVLLLKPHKRYSPENSIVFTLET